VSCELPPLEKKWRKKERGKDEKGQTKKKSIPVAYCHDVTWLLAHICACVVCVCACFVRVRACACACALASTFTPDWLQILMQVLVQKYKY
jgi:hypothetical protein